MAVQGIQHAYNIKKMKVPTQAGSTIKENALVLVQDGSAGVATVSDGSITWQEIGFMFSGYWDLKESLSDYKNLPAPFNKKLDTVFPDYDKSSSIAWATSGDQILQFNWQDDSRTKEPTSISNALPSLPPEFTSGLSAAMGGVEGGPKPTAWLFKGKQCVRVSYQKTTFTCGTAVNIQRKWKLNGQEVPALANGIDAAVRVPGTDIGYFFIGDKYVTCNVRDEKLTAGPQLIRSYWHNVPYAYPIPDAILTPARGHNPFEWYFFLGKYAHFTDDPATVFSGIPKKQNLRKITQHLSKLSGTVFADGVDSAVNIEGTSYLVKGSKIIKPFDAKPQVEDLSNYYGGSSRFIYPERTTQSPKGAVYDLEKKEHRTFSPAAEKQSDRPWQQVIKSPVQAAIQVKGPTPPFSFMTENRNLWLLGDGGQVHKPCRMNWELQWPDDPNT
ncbi:hypothetical protein [Streptomyces lunalinharesii]|uniref:Hemopexin n=1 Tax=Streptomyces lunalinharesii TaxID=333384 RepID=A0ABP6FJE6_9ACTN